MLYMDDEIINVEMRLYVINPDGQKVYRGIMEGAWFKPGFFQ